jgi:hypothetical protein
MHFSTALAAIAAVAPLVNAHDVPGAPKIAGLNMRDLKARSVLDNLKARAAAVEQHAEHHLKPRQGGTDGQCGASFGSCAAGYCCSESGCTFSPRPSSDGTNNFRVRQHCRLLLLSWMPVQVWPWLRREQEPCWREHVYCCSYQGRLGPLWRSRHLLV